MSIQPDTQCLQSPASVTFLPEKLTIEVECGKTILYAARQGGILIDAPCGESGRCGKCRIRVIDGNVSSPADQELAILRPCELGEGIRLSCMTTVLGNVVVEIPDSSRNLTHRKATAEIQRVVEPDAYTRKVCVNVPIPSLSNNDLRDDFSRLKEAVNGIKSADLGAVRSLHQALTDGLQTVTVVLAGGRLIAVEPGDTSSVLYGVALDIGTTTIVGYLVNLLTGDEVAVHSHPNPQSAYGADLISRIEFARGKPDHLESLRQSATNAINIINQALAADVGISIEQIYEMTVVGNTCMTHIFLGIDPIPLGHAPYTPVTTDSVSIPADILGLSMHPCGSVRTLPNIAGFIGADAVGMLAASNLPNIKGINVSVDIGTNAEVMVGMNGRVAACSTAAGPAFEGAKLSHGMRAQSGAIDGVVIGEDIFVHTINDRPALGICGSGVIDAVGELRRVGMLDNTGRFAERGDLPELPDMLLERLKDDGVVLVWAKESGTGHDIMLTKRDVREVQLVKSAICAGIFTMLSKLGRTTEELDALFIAGAFGTYINKEHALRIGLIPNIPLEKLVFLGNAAGIGAKMALISQKEFAAVTKSAHDVEYVELAGDPVFAENFMLAMTLDPPDVS